MTTWKKRWHRDPCQMQLSISLMPENGMSHITFESP
jgi:DNA polymerase epsilon subunit 1